MSVKIKSDEAAVTNVVPKKKKNKRHSNGKQFVALLLVVCSIGAPVLGAVASVVGSQQASAEAVVTGDGEAQLELIVFEKGNDSADIKEYLDKAEALYNSKGYFSEVRATINTDGSVQAHDIYATMDESTSYRVFYNSTTEDEAKIATVDGAVVAWEFNGEAIEADEFESLGLIVDGFEDLNLGFLLDKVDSVSADSDTESIHYLATAEDIVVAYQELSPSVEEDGSEGQYIREIEYTLDHDGNLTMVFEELQHIAPGGEQHTDIYRAVSNIQYLDESDEVSELLKTGFMPGIDTETDTEGTSAGVDTEDTETEAETIVTSTEAEIAEAD